MFCEICGVGAGAGGGGGVIGGVYNVSGVVRKWRQNLLYHQIAIATTLNTLFFL